MNHVIIFAGGIGTRMKSSEIPKQFMKVNDKEILAHTIEKFNSSQSIDQIVLVVLEEWIDKAKKIINSNGFHKVSAVLSGGDTAIDSQFVGLEYLHKLNISSLDIVLIHDGVRPLIDEGLIVDNINTVKKFGNSITTSPSNETIVMNEEESNTIGKIIARDKCSVARAPQSFYFGDIYHTHLMRLQEENPFFIDSASMMLHFGHKLTTVFGPSENIKITTPTDFYLFKSLLTQKENEELYGLEKIQ